MLTFFLAELDVTFGAHPLFVGCLVPSHDGVLPGDDRLRNLEVCGSVGGALVLLIVDLIFLAFFFFAFDIFLKFLLYHGVRHLVEVVIIILKNIVVLSLEKKVARVCKDLFLKGG